MYCAYLARGLIFSIMKSKGCEKLCECKCGVIISGLGNSIQYRIGMEDVKRDIDGESG